MVFQLWDTAGQERYNCLVEIIIISKYMIHVRTTGQEWYVFVQLPYRDSYR